MTNNPGFAERFDPFTTVLLVRKRPRYPDEIVVLLQKVGVNILGPVTRAADALAIVAQHHADLALIEPELAGRRDGVELARALEDTWGVRSLMLDRA